VPHKDIFIEHAKVSRETLNLYEEWHKLLIKWNAKINLVAKSTLPEFWVRHALDSWQITPLLRDRDRRVLDFGSGAGFPGIALAIGFADESTASVTLVGRLEDLSPFPADVITARAFAPLDRLFDYAEPFLTSHTQLLLLKGGTVDEELKRVSGSWTFSHETVKSLSDDEGCILVIKDLRRL